MDDFFTLLALMLLAGLAWIFVAPIVLFVRTRRLSLRIEQLEARLRATDPDFRSDTPTVSVESEAPASASTAAVPEEKETSPPVRETAADVPLAQTASMPPAPPKRFVVTEENRSRLANWMAQNWVSVVAVLSLTFAGIFFVRYGIEHGLLPPSLRVICGLALGGALIAAGEWVRRKGGSGPGTLGDLLPGTLAAGGIVSLYSAILGARVLYDLIGMEMTFAGLVSVAGIAVIFGLRHGAFLAIMGILGAVIVPFVVGGEPGGAEGLFFYFALIGGVALATDSYQRTAWISSIGLVAVYVGASLLYLVTSDTGPYFLAFAGLTAIGTITLPMRSIRPLFEDGMSFQLLHRQGPAEPSAFPTRLAMGGILGLAGVAVFVGMEGTLAFWCALVALSAMLAVQAFWLKTQVLDDAVPFVLSAILAIIALNGFWELEPARAFRTAEPGFGESGPQTMLWLTILAMAVTAAAGWKSAISERFKTEWAFGAAAFAPAVMGAVTLWWMPTAQMSDATWALHIASVSVLLTVLAQRALKRAGAERLVPSVYAVAALNMIAFAVSFVLTETALTLAFATVLLSAAWLDKRYDLPLLSYLVQIGTVVCGFRLLADPGVFWAQQAPLHEVLTAFGGVIAILFVALELLKTRDRKTAVITVESAAWSLPGVLACLLIFRALDDGDSHFSHWALSIYAMIWLISGAVQTYRAQIDNALRQVRFALAALFGGAGTVLLAGALTYANPLMSGRVIGPPLADSLAVAYALPAVILGVILWQLRGLAQNIRLGGLFLSGICAAMWVGLEIRRLWRGADLTVPGTIDGELYTYTVVLMIVGAGLLLAALRSGSATLRRVAMAVIGLTIAKVFLIDMSGLDGLIRVVAFLALGLLLAGLAWLDRMIGRRNET